MTEEDYRNVLNNIAGTFGMLRDQVNQAFEIGRALGLNDSRIGSDVRSRIKGLVSVSTIQRMLPDTAKQQQTHIASEKVVKMTAFKQPSIPARPEVVKEAEIVREPPKAEEPKTIEVLFDPSPIDRDRTQVFILQIDIVEKKVKKYKTVGRRTIK